MKTKKTVTPFNMQEIARALREMISEDSPNASEALLSGTREAVFREIFIFHYPSFLEKLYQSIPEVDKDEELICMLVALGQSVKEIAELIYFSPERVELLCASVCRKMNVTEVREMEMLMKKLLSYRIAPIPLTWSRLGLGSQACISFLLSRRDADNLPLRSRLNCKSFMASDCVSPNPTIRVSISPAMFIVTS